MAKSSVNNFNKGMSRDLGKTVPQESTYLEGRNIRIIANEDSLESGIVVNVDGNAFSFDLTYNCTSCNTFWELQGSVVWEPGIEVSVADVISVNGSLYYAYVIQNPTVYETLEDVLKILRLCTATDVEGLLMFSPEAAEECSADVIGWTTIRDTLYLFATDSEALNPGGVDNSVGASPSSVGVIFKVDFNLSTNAAGTPEVVYSHHELNFSKRHQIEAIGRYESKNVQRLYWTDNFNTVRTLNVQDPLLNELIPDDLDINPSVSFSKPEVVGVISSGELPAGMYQYAYRLKNSAGSETRFSPFTNFLHVVQASEGGAEYWQYSDDPENITEYTGSEPGVICPKSVRLRISNLDLDYDTIEVAAIYKSTKEGVSSSYIFARQTIASDTTEVVHNSSTSIIGLVSLTELTTFNYNIRKAKTLSTKDNRLFLGNVVTPLQELPFNARASRYKRDDERSQVHFPAATDAVTTYTDEGFDEYADYVDNPDLYPADFEYTLEENLDAINPYNELRAVNLSGKQYKYQKDGVTLGGEGANVSYTFIKKAISGDTFVGGTPATSPPYVEVTAEASSCITSVEWLDYKNPTTVEKFKGYQRDEVYRMGIVLHDLQGNPGFVNWVGDIRFPQYLDHDASGGEDLYNFTLSQTRSKQNAASGTEYHSTGSMSGTTAAMDAEGGVTSIGSLSFSSVGASHGKNTDIDTHEMYALGIEFSVTIPDHIKPLISGYSIVRMERKEIDKTVLGVGMGSWMYRFGDKSDSFGDSFQVAHSAYMSTWQHGSGESADEADDHGELRHTMMNMDSPDFALTGKYPTAGDCDWVQVVGQLSNGGSRNAWENDFRFEGEGTGTDDDFYRKMYGHSVAHLAKPENALIYMYNDNTSLSSGDADGAFYKPTIAKKLSSGGSIPSEFPGGINNIGVEVNGTTSQDTYSIGCDTLYLEFEGYASTGSWEGTTPLYDHNNGGTRTIAIACPYWAYWITAADGYQVLDNINRVYFNNNEEYDDDVTYFPGSTPYDTSRSGSEDDEDDRHNNPWGRSKVQAKPLLAWRRERPAQYGGNDHEARSRSIYMSTGVFVPVDASSEELNTSDVWGGDMFVHFYDFQKMRRWRGGESPDDAFVNNSSGPTIRHSFSFAIPVESTLNIGLRTGYHFANKDNFTGKQEDGYRLDQYEYNQVYSAEADLQEFYTRPYNYVESDEFDSRVLYSQLKTNGDKVDSWRQYKLDDYRDVDGAYGPINKLSHFSDTIYYLQDRGVGMLSINPVAITTAEDQSSIVLGTGAVIQDNKYLSTGVGCKHQWSVLSTNRGLYWLDILTNSIYKVSGEGTMELSRVKGIKSYFESVLENSNFSVPVIGDNPAYHTGITTGFDSKNNEVLFSFLEREEVQGGHSQSLEIKLAETLAYSETTGTFTSFYDFASPFLMDTQDKLLSVHPTLGHNVFLHNTGAPGSWYGVAYDSVLQFITNDSPTLTKTFDSFSWHTETTPGETWTSVTCFTDYQDSTAGVLIPDESVFRRERTWRTPVPRAKDLSRLRDKYLISKFIYENARGHKFKAHYIETRFRVSKR